MASDPGLREPRSEIVHLLCLRCGGLGLLLRDPGLCWTERPLGATTRWMSARRDTIEHIVLEFDLPQAISRLVYEVEEATRERTQEVRVEVSGLRRRGDLRQTDRPA